MRILTAFLLTLIATPLVAAYTVSDTNIYPGEPFSVVHCKNITQTCSTISKATTIPWNQSCSLTAYNTEGTTCQSTTVRGAYQDTLITIHNYKAQLEQSIANQEQAADAVSIAERLRAKAALNQSTRQERRTLKQVRSNDYKCWPRDDCSLKTTITILEQLSEAGYDRDDRIYDDGLTWVEAQQNSFENEEWELIIRPDFAQGEHCPEGAQENNGKCYVKGAPTNDAKYKVEKVEANNASTCTASLGGDEIFEETNDTAPFTTSFTYQANDVLNVTCDQDFAVQVKNFFGETQFVATEDNSETAQYLLPGGCWPRDDTNRICSLHSTSRALTLDELNADNEAAGEEWVNKQVQRSMITGERLEDEESVLTHVYLYEATENEELKDWLFYRQNNDGSFGAQHRLETTLEALNALSGNTDWIHDAKEWAQSQRPDAIKESTLLYERYKPNNPISTFTPSYLNLGPEGGSTTPEPGLDNATITIAESLQNAVTADYVDDLTVDVATTETGYKNGYITLDATSTDYEIPAVVNVEPSIDIKYKDKYYHEKPTGTIMPSLTKSHDVMNCTVTYSDVYDFVDQQLDDNTQIVVPYSSPQQGTHEVNTVATCETPHGTITDKDTFQATHYPSKPFTTSYTSTNVSGVETMTITNQLTRNITVSLTFENEALYYRVPSQVTIPPSHHADIYLFQDTSVPTSQAQTNTITAATMGYESSQRLTYNLGNHSRSQTPRYVVEQPTNPTVWVAALLLVVGLGGAAAVYLRSQSDTEAEEDSMADDEAVALAEVDAYLNEELGLSDQDTEEELREQGFDEDTIEETESFMDNVSDRLDSVIDGVDDNV